MVPSQLNCTLGFQWKTSKELDIEFDSLNKQGVAVLNNQIFIPFSSLRKIEMIRGDDSSGFLEFTLAAKESITFSSKIPKLRKWTPSADPTDNQMQDIVRMKVNKGFLQIFEILCFGMPFCGLC